MDKQEILDKLSYFYEQEMKSNQVFQLDRSNQELVLKLMQTTELFARSFDYELPPGHTPLAKAKNYIRRIIRRSTRFITKPYADKMQAYNESVCELLGQMINQLGSLNSTASAPEFQQQSDTISEILEKLESAVSQVRKLEIQNQVLETAVREHIRENDRDREMNSQQFEALQKKLSENKQENNEVIDGIKKVLNDTVNKSLEMGGQLSVLTSSTGTNSGNAMKWHSYSQSGEDRIVHFLLHYGNDQKHLVSYLDIGCNHYKELNNTYSFYEQGHRGVLVEANPHFIDDLTQNRPGDVVLNAGVSSGTYAEQTFYILNNVDLSSFDRQSISDAIEKSPWLKVVEEVTVPMMRIDQIIEQYCPGVPDVVSLDVEGLEMDILSSIDFEKYRPFIFIIETISYAATIQVEKKRKNIMEFMEKQEYGEYAFSGVNSIFVDLRKIKDENDENRN